MRGERSRKNVRTAENRAKGIKEDTRKAILEAGKNGGIFQTMLSRG